MTPSGSNESSVVTETAAAQQPQQCAARKWILIGTVETRVYGQLDRYRASLAVQNSPASIRTKHLCKLDTRMDNVDGLTCHHAVG